MKQFLKQSRSIQDFLHYYKGLLNGEIGYLQLQSAKSPNLSTGLIIDLELEKSFTSASSFKLLYLNREYEIAEKEKIRAIKLKDGLIFKNLKLKYITEDYVPSEIKRGDLIMINKEGDFGFALAENIKNSDKILLGRVINAKGLNILEEIYLGNDKITEEFKILEFSSLRKKILLKIMQFYAVSTVLAFLVVHFFYADQIDRPLVSDPKQLVILKEQK